MLDKAASQTFTDYTNKAEMVAYAKGRVEGIEQCMTLIPIEPGSGWYTMREYLDSARRGVMNAQDVPEERLLKCSWGGQNWRLPLQQLSTACRSGMGEKRNARAGAAPETQMRVIVPPGYRHVYRASMSSLPPWWCPWQVYRRLPARLRRRIPMQKAMAYYDLETHRTIYGPHMEK